MLEALRREPARWTAEDAAEALRLIRSGHAMLAVDRERAVAKMGQFLSAVSRVRRDGREVSFEAVAWRLAGEDEEGEAALRSLGGERPPRPVTPPGGWPATKK